MKIEDVNNLFVARNEAEDFNVLVCASDEEAAERVAADYGRDTQMKGTFKAAPFSSERIDCDYILTEHDKALEKTVVRYYYKECFDGEMEYGETLYEIDSRDIPEISRCNKAAREAFYDEGGLMSELEYFEKALTKAGLRFKILDIEMSFEY